MQDRFAGSPSVSIILKNLFTEQSEQRGVGVIYVISHKQYNFLFDSLRETEGLCVSSGTEIKMHQPQWLSSVVDWGTFSNLCMCVLIM